MKNYVITGATGYLGLNLVRRLLKDNHRVLCILRTNSNCDLLPKNEHLTIYKHQSDVEALALALKAFKPQLVFHLASNFIAEHQSEQVDALINANLLFGTQLLEAMTVAKVNNIINTGTNWQHYHSDQYDPVCLYAATKEAFEKILQFYVKARQLNCITLKLFDIYGPGDFRKKLIPLLEKYAITGDVLEMSSGEQALDMVHVDDVVEAYLTAEMRLRERDCLGVMEEFAVASGQPLALQKIVELLEVNMGKKISVRWGARPYRTREVMTLWSNYKILPRWNVKYFFPEGLGALNSKSDT